MNLCKYCRDEIKVNHILEDKLGKKQTRYAINTKNKLDPEKVKNVTPQKKILNN